MFYIFIIIQSCICHWCSCLQMLKILSRCKCINHAKIMVNTFYKDPPFQTILDVKCCNDYVLVIYFKVIQCFFNFDWIFKFMTSLYLILSLNLAFTCRLVLYMCYFYFLCKSKRLTIGDHNFILPFKLYKLCIVGLDFSNFCFNVNNFINAFVIPFYITILVALRICLSFFLHFGIVL